MIRIHCISNIDVVQYKAEMKISDDFETNNRTVLEIIQDIINQVLSIINKKAIHTHTHTHIYILCIFYLTE